MTAALTDRTPFFERLSHRVAGWAGSSLAFIITLGATLLWAVSGPFFHYSVEWQLVMNTVSSAVTFVMVFLLQRSQNKDTLAMQIKLNEIIGALVGANNHLISIEDLSEAEILLMRKNYQKLAAQIQSDDIPSTSTVSIGDIAPKK